MKYVFPTLIVLVLAGGGFALNRAYPGALGDLDGVMGLVYLLALLALWIGFGGIAARPGQALRHLGIWILMIAGLIAGYAWRGDISSVASRAVGTLVPAEPLEEGGRTTLRRGANGQFSAMVTVNGTRVRMLVDTGASLVVLPYDEARRVGIDVGALRFNVPVSTANGTAFTARVSLRNMHLGSLALDNVRGAVAEPGRLSSALLGMSFLNRLDGYAVEGDRMVLY